MQIPAPSTPAISKNQAAKTAEMSTEEGPSSASATNSLVAADEPSSQTIASPLPKKNLAAEALDDPEKKEPTLPIGAEPQENIEKSPVTDEDLTWLDAPQSALSEKNAKSIEIVHDHVNEPTAEPASFDSPRTTIAVWQLSSKWSLAAAYFAKGIESDRYGDSLEQAKYAAKLVDIELPDFLVFREAEKRQAKIASFLVNDAGPRLVREIAEGHTGHHAALADLAIKTHALLLVYTPLNDNLAAMVSAIRISAENSELPEEVWLPLVGLLEQRGSFQEVKQAVFQLHTRAPAHFGGSAAK